MSSPIRAFLLSTCAALACGVLAGCCCYHSSPLERAIAIAKKEVRNDRGWAQPELVVLRAYDRGWQITLARGRRIAAGHVTVEVDTNGKVTRTITVTNE